MTSLALTVLGVSCREVAPATYVGALGNILVHVQTDSTGLGPLYRVSIHRSRDLECLSRGIGSTLASAAASAEAHLRTHAEERLVAFDALRKERAA